MSKPLNRIPHPNTNLILGCIRMVKISKSKTGQFRVTINPQIMAVFNLDPEKEYEWVSIQGLPALGEGKEA